MVLTLKPILPVVAVAALMAGLLASPRTVHAATFAVTTTADAAHTTPLNGNCTSTLAGNPCTLRAAVQAANFLGGGPHTINLTVAGTYALTVAGAGESGAATGDLNVTVSLTIANTSGGTIVVDGTALNDRVFDVSPAAAAQVAISGITIQNGTTSLQGGGIQVGANATLRLDTVTLTGNTAAQGGAIANSGTLVLTNTTLTNNLANSVGSGGGGGLLNLGTATLTNGAISSNEAFNPGGGIFNGGTATLTNVQVVGNVSEGNGGGGIENTGSATLAVTGGAISDNAVASASGGGLDNESGGTAALTNVTVHHNSAIGGGGVNNGASSSLTLTGVTVDSNEAVAGNGVFSNFVGGGGVWNQGTATITNTTVALNITSGGLGGGGVFNAGGSGFQGQAGTISLTNVTISQNGSFNNRTPQAGGGIGIFQSGTVRLLDTIVASNTGGDCGQSPPGGVITSQGHNLSSDNTCSLQAAGDLNNTNPRLGSLANNGGPTQTLALLAGSPAIDAGSPSCPPPATDQRGVRRPQGAHCDIGAFELEQAGGVLQTPTPSPTATPLRTSTPSPTATPVRLSVPQAVAQVRPSGQTGVACAGQVGQTCQAAGGVHGSGTVSGSMTWNLTATVPAGVVPGTVPVAVLSTTAGLQGFACAPVAAGGGTATCIGTTAANALQNSVVTVVFAPGVIAAGTVASPGAGATAALVIVPLVPPPVVPPPLIAPPPPFAVPPLLPPALPQPVQPAMAGPAPEVPVVPEADSLDLVAGGLLGLALALGLRRAGGQRRD